MCFFQFIDVMIDAVVDAWHNRKIKRKANKEKENILKADKFNRDDIEVPVIVEEKRSSMISDPGLDDANASLSPSKDHRRLSMREDTIMTMKKVSSLALV